jgi:hypothetical protein
MSERKVCIHREKTITNTNCILVILLMLNMLKDDLKKELLSLKPK